MTDLKDIDIARISNDDLLFFVQEFEHKDKDLTSIIKMLPTATGHNTKKLRDILQKIKDGKKPIVVYPGIDDVDTSGLEYVGEVNDGAIYLK